MLFGKKKKIEVKPQPPVAPAPAPAPAMTAETAATLTRFEKIFAATKSRGLELREQMFAAAERGDFGAIKPLADEMFVLDFLAKNAQLAHAKAIEASAPAEKVAAK